MRLPPQETERFYRIWFALLHYINTQLHLVPAFPADFASTILLESDPPRGVLDLTFADIESYVKGKPGKQPLTSFKRFVRFLLSTGRIDYEMGENLYDLLKQVSKGQ